MSNIIRCTVINLCLLNSNAENCHKKQCGSWTTTFKFFRNTFAAVLCQFDASSKEKCSNERNFWIRLLITVNILFQDVCNQQVDCHSSDYSVNSYLHRFLWNRNSSTPWSLSLYHSFSLKILLHIFSPDIFDTVLYFLSFA